MLKYVRLKVMATCWKWVVVSCSDGDEVNAGFVLVDFTLRSRYCNT